MELIASSKQINIVPIFNCDCVEFIEILHEANTFREWPGFYGYIYPKIQRNPIVIIKVNRTCSVQINRCYIGDSVWHETERHISNASICTITGPVRNRHTIKVVCRIFSSSVFKLSLLFISFCYKQIKYLKQLKFYLTIMYRNEDKNLWPAEPYSDIRMIVSHSTKEQNEVIGGSLLGGIDSCHIPSGVRGQDRNLTPFTVSSM